MLAEARRTHIQSYAPNNESTLSAPRFRFSFSFSAFFSLTHNHTQWFTAQVDRIACFCVQYRFRRTIGCPVGDRSVLYVLSFGAVKCKQKQASLCVLCVRAEEVGRVASLHYEKGVTR